MLIQLLRAVTLALCLASAPVAHATATPAQLTASQWREDLTFMVADMKARHANLYHKVDQRTFDAAVADLNARIPGLARNQIIVGMMRIAALVGDGHTRVDPRKDAKFQFPSLPVKLYAFDDGLFIRAARQDHAGLIGGEIIAIGGVPVAEANRRVATLISRDNVMAHLLMAPLYLAMPDVLHALGLASSAGAADLTIAQGHRRRTVRLAVGEVDPPWPPDTDISLTTPAGWVDANPGPDPLWLQAPLDYHRLIELPKQRAVYAQFNMVTDIEGQSVADYAARIAGRAAAIGAGSIILDLRLNYGGNGNLRTELVKQLVRAEGAGVQLFVLTARGTFSASQFILDDLDRLTNAMIIGEPASSSPTSYGDAYRTIMPNSGIAVRSSIAYWQQGQNFDPWTWVDIAAPLRFADYAAGRDPGLEAALGYEPPTPLRTTLYAAAKAGGLAGAKRAIAAYLAAPANRYVNGAVLLPEAAEWIMIDGHVAEALAVAQAASDAYPGSLDAWLVLAYVALRAERNDIARDAARTAMRIDPNQRSARSFLEQASQ